MNRSPRRERSRARSSFDPSIARFLSQARQSLYLALASVDDPRLVLTSVLDVRVAPGHGPLSVVIGAPADAIEEARTALVAAKGRLRAELAAALQRKRAPELSFFVVPTDGWSERDEEETP